MTGFGGNHRHSFTTGAAEFMLEQRNAGFDPNDGRWILNQLPELYWSRAGALYRRRAGRFVGVFEDSDAARDAAAAAGLMPVVEEMVL